MRTRSAASPLREHKLARALPCFDTPLRIDTIARDGSLVLAVHGELDITTSPLLDEALAQARSTDAANIVVDLLAVSFIDSTALHVLIKHAGADEDRARIRLTEASPQIQRLFRLSGALDYLPLVAER
jgi:anti-sigma B factor antagonist